MVVRLLLGILAVTFLPLGIAFVVVGLTVDEPDRGQPEAFLYSGIAFTAVGAALAIGFVVMWRREAERRRRRREGLRTTAEIVRAQFNPSVRVNGRLALKLTVRFATAGTPDGTVTTTVLAAPSNHPTEGERIEIVYDPAEPSNFEPVTR
jgi:hypothetical protein